MGQKLLIPTTFLLALLSFIAIWNAPLTSPMPYRVDVSRFNTFGEDDAPVHLVLFEEFACAQCRRFHLEDLPVLEEKYIKPGIAKITFVPLAYLENSENAFISANCVAKEDKEHQKGFLSHLYSLSLDEMENSSPHELLKSYGNVCADFYAEKSIGRIYSPSHDLDNENNQLLSNQIQNGEIEVPLLLVNGERVHQIDIDKIAKVIEREKRR